MRRTFMPNSGRAIILGLALSLLLTIGFVSITASLLLSGAIPESRIQICTCTCLVISIFTGTLVAARGGETKIAIRIVVVGILYGFILLAAGILALGGPVNHLLRNLLCILAGCVAACAICIRKGKSKRGRKKPIR